MVMQIQQHTAHRHSRALSDPPDSATVHTGFGRVTQVESAVQGQSKGLTGGSVSNEGTICGKILAKIQSCQSQGPTHQSQLVTRSNDISNTWDTSLASLAFFTPPAHASSRGTGYPARFVGVPNTNAINSSGFLWSLINSLKLDCFLYQVLPIRSR